ILPEWNIIDTSINVCYEYTSPISGKTWKQSGFYTDTIHRPGACDSVFRITLNVLDQTRTLKRKACDSFITSSGKVYYSSGTYVDKYQNQLGCDSFIVWDLTINKSSLARIAVFDCYQYTMPSKKYTVYESGVYVDTIKTKRGCDSILTVVVTIPPRRPDTTHIKGCGAYYVPSGKLQMTKSGFYYDTLRTHYGCDSLALIDFEQQQTSSLFTLKACLETFSPSGKYFYTQSGRYYDTMLNKAGCDSFMTIDLVLFDTFITNVETAFCDSFISPLGRVYKSNAEFTEILESQSGCDSTLHFNLTSNGFSASILEQTGYLESDVLADEYQWLECGSNKGKVLATDAKFVPDFSSSFKLAVKKNNCWDTTECLPFYTAGVYPNPTTGQILLSFGAEVENCQVIIIDPLGREINFLQLGNMEHQWIDLPQQSGMYVLHITGNNIEPLLEKVLVVRK
ncbi:MAG: T9SS type A sorting domain-containing protein, partial [Bacteroidetes bacterium]|nr:T9SS type A sorting domain-containing protein [Bacteroidota bacterium]